MQQTSFWKNNFVPLGVLLGVSFIIAIGIAGYTALAIKDSSNVLDVTGSAKIAVTSDQVKWSGDLERVVRASVLQSGYAQIAKDNTLLVAFLKNQGVDMASVDISPVSVQQNYDYSNNGGNQEKEYTLRQHMSVSSTDIAKITDVAKKAGTLIQEGVIFNAMAPEYYYSKLPDVRISLLSDAIKDAKTRAEKLAEFSGQGVGKLKKASIGVVQVLAKDATEVSDYGSYDTSTVEKDIMVTVHATFSLN